MGGHPADLIPIVQRVYDPAVSLYRYVNRLPKAHKLLLARTHSPPSSPHPEGTRVEEEEIVLISLAPLGRGLG